MQDIDKIISSKWILSSKNNSLLKDYSIAIEGNIIKDILPSKEVLKKYKSTDHLMLKNNILVPGLINNNVSTPYIFTRKSLNDNSRQKIDPKKYLELSTNISICQMIKNGITTFTDTSSHPEIVLKQSIKSGIRANVGLPISSYKSNWANKEQEYFKKTISFYDEYRNDPSIKLYLNLNSIHMLSKRGFEKVSQIVSELDVPVRMHLHEDLNKLNIFKRKYKKRPVKYLEELGLLGTTFTAINPFHINQSDLNIMQKYKIHIVHTPSFNIVSRNTQCNTKLFLKNNIKVSIGTGEYIIGNSVDLFNEMRIASLLSKLSKDESNHLTQKELLGLIMKNASNALGLSFDISRLEPKCSADIISIKINNIDMSSIDLYKDIENKLNSNNIEHVWVAGKQILKDKKLLTINEDMLYHKFTELVKK